MHIKQRARLLKFFSLLLLIASGVYITLSSLQNNIIFLRPPSELLEMDITDNKVRVGGVVKFGSVLSTPPITHFIITDNKAEMKITYKGILPALFRQGQGVVAEGVLNKDDGVFYAETLLTKHDENYYPPKKP